MSYIRKLDQGEPLDVAYYDGYHRGHRDTARMLARRSLAYLLVGAFFGAATIFMAFNAGVIDRIGASPIVEDPALSQDKPDEYVRVVNWAKRYTVGIVSKSPDRIGRTWSGWHSRIPGQQHIGSGVILTEDGYILTNAHVIPADAAQLSVVLGDDLYEARFVGHRPEYDLAVIKINATGLVPASLGDSDNTVQGDVVIALGSPHGLFHTATEGIISYAGRRTTVPGTAVRNYLQTSAAINPGNSGGPLVDMTGRVVGINTWRLGGRGGEATEGVGFAIPINTARRVFEAIIRTDDPERDSELSSLPRSLQSAFLGVSVDVSPRGAAQEDAGARIDDIIYGTAADRAGLKAGDVIVDIGGQAVRNIHDLRAALAGRQPGDVVALTYERAGTPNTIEITLGD
jgi:S1-C subfamily serine protease